MADASMPKRRMVPMLVVSAVLLSTVVVPAAGLPYMLLTTTRPKCVGIIAAQGQTITIGYDMPGEF